jgi:hypothetical protein
MTYLAYVLNVICKDIISVIIDLYGKVKSIQINLIIWISELNKKKRSAVQILPIALKNECVSSLKDCLSETEARLCLMSL